MPLSVTQPVTVMGQAVQLNPAWVSGVQGSWYLIVLGWPGGSSFPLLPTVSMQSAAHTEKEQSTSAFGE